MRRQSARLPGPPLPLVPLQRPTGKGPLRICDLSSLRSSNLSHAMHKFLDQTLLVLRGQVTLEHLSGLLLGEHRQLPSELMAPSFYFLFREKIGISLDLGRHFLGLRDKLRPQPLTFLP